MTLEATIETISFQATTIDAIAVHTPTTKIPLRQCATDSPPPPPSVWKQSELDALASVRNFSVEYGPWTMILTVNTHIHELHRSDGWMYLCICRVLPISNLVQVQKLFSQVIIYPFWAIEPTMVTGSRTELPLPFWPSFFYPFFSSHFAYSYECLNSFCGSLMHCHPSIYTICVEFLYIYLVSWGSASAFHAHCHVFSSLDTSVIVAINVRHYYPFFPPVPSCSADFLRFSLFFFCFHQNPLLGNSWPIGRSFLCSVQHSWLNQ